MDRYCSYCRKPAPIGFHAKCLLGAIRIVRCAPPPPPPAALPCSHCPYRKDRPFWLNLPCLVFNATLIRLGLTQGCHLRRDLGTCAGAVTCLAGGDEQVYSAEEFLALGPCPHDEARDRYGPPVSPQ